MLTDASQSSGVLDAGGLEAGVMSMVPPRESWAGLPSILGCMLPLYQKTGTDIGLL